MGFRFRRSIKLLPGVRLNLSKSGVSASIGQPGATVNIGGKAGPKATVGLPGSGLSFTQHLHTEPSPGQQETGGFGRVLLIVLALLIVYALFGWA